MRQAAFSASRRGVSRFSHFAAMSASQGGSPLDELLKDIRLKSYIRDPTEFVVDRSQPIGGGGFGTVFSCRYRRAKYALKVIAFAGLDAGRRKLQEEIAADELRAAIELHSPEHVTTLIAIARPSDEELWLVFDFVRGCTLADVRSACTTLRKAAATEGPDGTENSDKITDIETFLLQILVCLVRSVNYLHSCGVAHLDLTTVNSMVPIDDRAQLRVRLIDFGCARVTGSVGGVTLVTGLASQTPVSAHYAAPEVAVVSHLLAAGHPPDIRLTVQADMFSLGLIALELLTCVPAVVLRNMPLPMLPQLPRFIPTQVRDLLSACIDTHRLPEQRPTASQLLDALEQVTSSDDMVASLLGQQVLGGGPVNAAAGAAPVTGVRTAVSTPTSAFAAALADVGDSTPMSATAVRVSPCCCSCCSCCYCCYLFLFRLKNFSLCVPRFSSPTQDELQKARTDLATAHTQLETLKRELAATVSAQKAAEAKAAESEQRRAALDKSLESFRRPHSRRSSWHKSARLRLRRSRLRQRR